MTMSKRKNLSATQKNIIAVRQHHRCATVFGYQCPFQGKMFDAAGFHIDHIVELADGGNNETNNLQALCHSCHAFKTFASMQRRNHQKPEYMIIEKNISIDLLTKYTVGNLEICEQFLAGLLDVSIRDLYTFFQQKKIKYSIDLDLNILHVELETFVKKLPKTIHVKKTT